MSVDNPMLHILYEVNVTQVLNFLLVLSSEKMIYFTADLCQYLVKINNDSSIIILSGVLNILFIKVVVSTYNNGDSIQLSYT